jgi:TetR/AcrR family transcriptional regulator, tetracycline repressor protein
MPRRAGQPPLTRDRIVTAALRLIDEAGLDALSMRRLGKELGVDPMAVYHHVKGKDALLRAVVQHVFAAMPPPATGGPWDERVRQWARAYRGLAEAHPNLVLRIVSDPAAVSVAAVHVNETLYAALEASGLPPKAVLRGANLVVDYVNGYALAFAAGPLPPDALATFEAELDARPPEEVAVQRRLREQARDDADAGGADRDGFEFDLDVILAGLAALLAR